MEVYVARQPIFRVNEDIFGYELLYRNNKVLNYFPDVDGDQATSDVIINSFLNIGIEKLSEGKPCFINFTENLLKLDLPTYFNPNLLIVEILESVQPSDEVIEICRKLKEQGYRIAIDDFYMDANDVNTSKLLAYADIVKVDILNTPVEKERWLLQKLKGKHFDLLAEKVETKEQFEQCVRHGYNLFQGYFFSKPTILSTIDIPNYFNYYMQIIHELSNIEPDIDLIASIVEKDVSLSYKLLKLVNSPAIRPVSSIRTIKQAILLLGLNEIRRWIYVLAVRDSVNHNNKPTKSEVIKVCFTRAKMCELVAESVGKQHEKSSFFLAGMLSLIDCLLDSPLIDIMNELPVDLDIKQALLNESTNIYSQVLELVFALERNETENIAVLCENMNIPQQHILKIYHQSLEWAVLNDSLID